MFLSKHSTGTGLTHTHICAEKPLENVARVIQKFDHEVHTQQKKGREQTEKEEQTVILGTCLSRFNINTEFKTNFPLCYFYRLFICPKQGGQAHF